MMSILYKGINNKKTNVYLLTFVKLFVMCYVAGMTFFMVNPKLYWCVNIDVSIHHNLALYYAGQETFNQNAICPKFRLEGRPDNYFMNYLDKPYEKNYHYGVGLLARTFNIPADWLMAVINTAIFWGCFLFVFEIVKLYDKEVAWLSIFALISWPDPLARIVFNGWVTQNLVNFILLFALYLSVYIYVRATNKFGGINLVTFFFYLIFYVIPMSLLFFVVVLLSHEVAPLLSFWINPIDQYRTFFSALFILVPVLVISIIKFCDKVLFPWIGMIGSRRK